MKNYLLQLRKKRIGVVRLLGAAVAAAVLFVVVSPGAALSDWAEEAKARPATREEVRFIERIDKEISAAFPLPGDAWEVKRELSKGRFELKAGADIEFYEYENVRPVRLFWDMKFHLPSSAEAKKARVKKEDKRNVEVLKKELAAAAMSGDIKKMARLQQEMAESMRARMGADRASLGAGPKQEKGPSTPARDFIVTVSLNEGGERIGKVYDTSTPGVTKSFRIERKGNLEYKYYIGDWSVSELDRANWQIVFPERHDAAGNHLRSFTLFVAIDGDSDLVEAYVRDHFSPGALNAILR